MLTVIPSARPQRGRRAASLPPPPPLPARWSALLALLVLLAWSLIGPGRAAAQSGLVVHPSMVTLGQPVTASVDAARGSIDWGDGQTTTLTSNTAIHTYEIPGTYMVTWNCTPTAGPCGRATVTVTAPAAAPTLSVSPESVLAGQPVTATTSGLQPGDTLDWGDGAVVPAQSSQTHAYEAAGTFTAQLLRAGRTVAAARVVVRLPTPTLTVTPDVVSVGQPVTATVTNAQPGDLLDWGDGVTVPATLVQTHAYAAPGGYGVRLLRQGDPVPNVPTQGVKVTPAPTPTLAVTPTTVQPGQTVTATTSGLQPGDALEWGDGAAVPAAPSQTHTYGAAGTFVVRLMRGELPVAGVAPVPVTVRAPLPPPTLDVSPNSVLIGQPVSANVTNPPPGAQLDWGDGAVVPAAPAQTHAYGAAGTFAVRLLDANRTPLSGVAPAPVTVNLPTPTLAVAPTTVQPGQAVTATTSGLQPGDALDWGDGAVVPAAPSQTHPYGAAGTFVVRLLRGGQPVAGVAPVPVTVSLPLPVCTLEASPDGAVQRWDVLKIKVNGLEAGTPYTLDWGDGAVTPGVTGALTRPGDGLNANTQEHRYAAVGSFGVRVTAGATVCLRPVTVTPAAVPLSAVPAAPAVDEKVALTAGNVPAGTALRVDWGDGAAETRSVAADGGLGTHAYRRDGPFTVKVSLVQGGTGEAGELLGTLPVLVAVPLPTLAVTPARAGAASTLTAGGVETRPGYAYTYTLDFGDGTPARPVTQSGDLPHVYAASGVYPVRLTVKADQADPRTVTVPAVIGAAVEITAFGTEVRPQGKPGIPAPSPATLALSAPADSVALITATGGGVVNLRWTWTPLNAADQPDGQALTLETRPVTLQPGPNTVPLTLPTARAGRYLLRVEALGVTGDAQATFPGRVTAQPVNVAAPGLPKFLVLGEGDQRFRFKVTGAAKPVSGPAFDPDNFWPTLEVADDSPLKVGLTVITLAPIQAQSLKVTVDDDTATLVSGSFEGLVSTKNARGQAESSMYAEFPAFDPMRLRVGRLAFSPQGAVLKGAVVTSPDYTAAQVTLQLPPLKVATQKGPTMPAEIIQALIDPIFDPAFDVGFGPGGLPISTPALRQRLSRQLGTTLYAQGPAVPGAHVNDVSAPDPFLTYTLRGQLPTDTGAGSGYYSARGASLLDAAARRGVYVGTGLSAAQAAVTVPGLISGPRTVAQLQEILGAGQVDFLNFPELYLNNLGDVVSAAIIDGRSVASLPTEATDADKSASTRKVANGRMNLGDSGVSVEVAGVQQVYLDLSSRVSVEPQGYAPAQGGAARPGQGQGQNQGRLPDTAAPLSQAELLRRTYGGAPSVVEVPDVGPAWQGLLWLSNTLSVGKVVQYDATKPDAAYDAGEQLTVKLVQPAPLSYGTRGWNLNIEGQDGQVAAGGSSLKGGIPYEASSVVVVMVKTNLIRSLTTGAFGPLPFVGGPKLTGTWNMAAGTVKLDQTGLTRGYGPDGSYVAQKVTGNVNAAGVLTFTLSGTFDFSRLGDGLKVTCSKLLIDGGLAGLPQSTCAPIKGQNRVVAGTPLTLDKVAFSSGGEMSLSGLAALGSANDSGQNITAPARFVLKATAGTYSLRLDVDDTAQQISQTPGHEIRTTLKGKSQPLTNLGAQAIGAGLAAAPNRELSFDSGTVAVSDKLSMNIKGVFGRGGGKSYWYLLATGKAADGIPLSIITVYEVRGGLAYNMDWAGGNKFIAFGDLDRRPGDGQGLHLAAGVVASFTGVDDKTLHAALIAELSSSPPQLRFGGDGYLLTGGLNTPQGYPKGRPQARFGGLLNQDGLFVDLCVGPANVGDLKCSDLGPLSVADGVVTIQGAASLEISKTPHVYVGTFRPKTLIGQPYCNPTTDAACAALYRSGRVSATVDLRGVYKATIDGYVMTGVIDGRGPSFVAPGSVGLAAGASIEKIYHAGDSGSLLLCDYAWSFDARLFAAVDGAIVIVPEAYIHGHLGLYAGAKVSASGCGIGASASASVNLDADFQVGSKGWVDGTVGVEVHLPVVPDVSFSKHIRLDIY